MSEPNHQANPGCVNCERLDVNHFPGAGTMVCIDCKRTLRERSEKWLRLRELIGFYLRQAVTAQTDLTLYRRHFDELRSLLSLDGKDGA